MDILNKDKYIEFSHVLSGCRTITDAYSFAEVYIKHNPEMAILVYSMVNGKRYEQILDFKTVKKSLEVLTNLPTKDEGVEYSENQTKQTTDITQKKMFVRVLKNKPIETNSHIKIHENTDVMITKKCPHCGNNCNSSMLSTYVICGYTNNHTGYDWKGCGKDWCFSCGKKLCKSWEINELFVEKNRYHDKNCCKKCSVVTGVDYISKYCQCNNKNVNRN